VAADSHSTARHISPPVADIARDPVEAGRHIATVEAMEMEAAVKTPVRGTVERVSIAPVQQA
jgi:pyruvate carboxylase